jgi:hypothetical protein
VDVLGPPGRELAREMPDSVTAEQVQRWIRDHEPNCDGPRSCEPQPVSGLPSAAHSRARLGASSFPVGGSSTGGWNSRGSGGRDPGGLDIASGGGDPGVSTGGRDPGFPSGGRDPGFASGGQGLGGTWASGGGWTTGATSPIPNGSRLQIQLQGEAGYPDEAWCVDLVSASGTIPWQSFNTRCWDNSGAAYTGTVPLESVMVLVVGDNTEPVPFDFCLNAIGVVP